MDVFCFFAGVAFFQFKSIFSLLIIAIALWFRYRKILFLWFILGFVWSYGHSWMISTRGLPNESVISRATLEGVIVSIPRIREDSVQFDYDLISFNHKKASGLIRLACYQQCPDVHVGDAYRLVAKLKRPQNLGNPGGYDYAGGLLAHHIEWTGYTASGSFHYLPQKKKWSSLILKRLERSKLLEHLDTNPKTIGIFEALTLGLTHRMDKDTWDLFRRTGTTHLMVISGAHIGLVAGLSYRFVQWLWRRSAVLLLFVPAQRVASGAGLMMACCYALIAGFGVPAQRAVIVCLFMFLRFMSQIPFSVWQAWRCALFFIITYEPHSVTLPGFYLSFIAVAILIAVNQRVSLSGIKKTIVLQLACLFGLMPLTLFYFGYGSVNGFFANVIAIPWVSFFIIPLALMITVLVEWIPMDWPVVLLKWEMERLLWYLHWVDHFSMMNIELFMFGLLKPLALMLGIGLLVFFPLVSCVPAILILLLASFFPRYEKIKPGFARVDILDVGQGLSVVVRTAQHRLMYDTGVKFYHGSDMGQLAIIPYLKTQGIKQLDAVVISHPDLDHRGGLPSIQKEYPIQRLLVDDISFYNNALPCHEASDWRWDGVLFKFFPIQGDFKGKNNRSCVLQISTHSGQVILTGDIEKPAEDYLVKRYAHQLASSVLVVPHHGSKTSSSTSLIEHINPQYAVVSYGFDNRYHFPHTKPMLEYAKKSIPVYSTTSCGLIRIDLTPNAQMKAPICSLQTHYIDKIKHMF